MEAKKGEQYTSILPAEILSEDEFRKFSEGKAEPKFDSSVHWLVVTAVNLLYLQFTKADHTLQIHYSKDVYMQDFALTF